jgi:hypothetical protein
MEKESALLDEKIAAATKSLEERLARDRAELEEGVRKTEAQLWREIARALGGVFHVQALSWVKEGAYEVAFMSGIDGLSSFIDSEDHLNLRRLLSLIVEGCLTNMTKAQLDEMEKETKAFHKVMLRIKKWDVNRDFTDAVDAAERAFKAASERVPAAETKAP